TYLIGLYFLFIVKNAAPSVTQYLPGLFSIIGFVLVLKSFSERKSPLLSWMLLIANHFCVALAISFNEYFSFQEAIFYLSGVSVAGFIGVLCLAKLRKYEKNISLNRFYGLSYEHPKLALLFLLVCLALMGFPITTTFIGEDLIFKGERPFLRRSASELAPDIPSQGIGELLPCCAANEVLPHE
ncbi:MAG: hypothetical protein EOP04_31590, partial [Proteobacteria bacterium]